MVRISVFYPTRPGSHFDADYYINTHMPRSIELLGPHMNEISAEIGLAGGVPDQPPPFAAIATFTCESVEQFTTAFLAHADELQGDIPNYTNIVPTIQVSEIRITK